ncbi:MAG: PadR family transcriptional regulator [Anaerolineales bacterium]
MMHKQGLSDVHAKLTHELRRGVLVLATLSQLVKSKYGYALMNDLAERGLEIDQGTLYPLLRRLEAQGLLESAWSVEGSRPRRYYVISAEGASLLDQLKTEWRELTAMLDDLLDG